MMIHLICPNPAVDRTLLLETIETAIPNRPIEVKEFPGGKSFNVAYALTYEKVAPQITIHTMLGGIYGEHVANLSNERGYNMEITKVNTNTRLCNILVDTQKREIVPVYEKGFDLDADLLEKFTNRLVSSIKPDDILVFSGSLMKGMPDNYISLIEEKLQAANTQIKLCVDTSGVALKSVYEETNPYLIKINDEEIGDIFPDKRLKTKEDYLNLLRNDVKEDIQNFIITLGKDGIVARMDNQLYEGSASRVEAKNPIACGDFFLGRLVRGIERNDSPVETLKSSLLFSTCNVLNWYPEVTDSQLELIEPTITVSDI